MIYIVHYHLNFRHIQNISNESIIHLNYYSATNKTFDFNKYRHTIAGYQNTLVLMENDRGFVFGGFLSKGIPYAIL